MSIVDIATEDGVLFEEHLQELETRLAAVSFAYDTLRALGIDDDEDLRLLDQLRRRRDALMELLVEVGPGEDTSRLAEASASSWVGASGVAA
jgi:hypothetical protein